jgi:O-methyltransferase involved in polyketide biosynthesis
MAAVRALEAERPDRLFNDTLSHELAGEEAMRQARERFNASR